MKGKKVAGKLSPSTVKMQNEEVHYKFCFELI